MTAKLIFGNHRVEAALDDPAPMFDMLPAKPLIFLGWLWRFVRRRREFIAALGGAAAAWPVAARAQQGDRVRRIGVLMPFDENEPLPKARVSAFTQALAGLGWTDGRNVRMDVRWGGGDINRIRALAQELVGLQPDIILVGSTSARLLSSSELQFAP